MSEQLEILIHWEIGALEDKLEELKKELHTLMIDRNTAGLRVVALEFAQLPYPSDEETLESLDQRVAEMVEKIQYTRRQMEAWETLLRNLDDPSIQQQVQPMIRTVELQSRSRTP